MTTEEKHAREFLHDAKLATKGALAELDPNPAEPIATAILAVIDALDRATRALAERAK